MAQEIAQEIFRLVKSGKPFTDVRFEQDQPFLWYTPDEWRPTGFGVVTRDHIDEFMREIDTDYATNIIGKSIGRTINMQSCRLRANFFTTHRGSRINAIIRKHPTTVGLPMELGIDNMLTRLIGYAKGLVIVTGPTSSGKTTTLMSLLQHLNGLRPMHIITLEDPIEIPLTPDKSVISQREIPHDVATFELGLHEALRQKPSVIMIGEVRDRESAQTMLNAAESGHLVFASFHTNSSEGAISKILSFFPGQTKEILQLLSLNLLAVVCQALVPSTNRDKWELASETLYNTAAVSRALREGDFGRLSTIMMEQEDKSSRHLNRHLAALIKEKRITAEDASRAAYDQVGLEALVGPIL